MYLIIRVLMNQKVRFKALLPQVDTYLLHVQKDFRRRLQKTKGEQLHSGTKSHSPQSYVCDFTQLFRINSYNLPLFYVLYSFITVDGEV